jgi:hypothetical protein
MRERAPASRWTSPGQAEDLASARLWPRADLCGPRASRMCQRGSSCSSAATWNATGSKGCWPRLVRSAAARSCCRGDPGIGKSALCAWAVAQAAGMRVLSVRGVESEADLPFAALSELCAGELDRLGLLPDPQARALEGALTRRDAPPGDRFAIGAAVLSLLAVAGDGDSVLVIVDDAQWLDASSADALLFAARRAQRRGRDAGRHPTGDHLRR